MGFHLCCRVASLHTESKPWKSQRCFNQPEEKPEVQEGSRFRAQKQTESTVAVSGPGPFCRVLGHPMGLLISLMGRDPQRWRPRLQWGIQRCVLEQGAQGHTGHAPYGQTWRWN